jgi:hypothetical protein
MELGEIPFLREAVWGEQIGGFIREVTGLGAAKEEGDG